MQPDPPVLPTNLASLAVEPLDAERLREIAILHGMDAAALLLYEKLRSQHASYINRINRSAANLTKDSARDCSPATDAPLFAVMPGAFWKDHRRTGADGQRLLDLCTSLGLPCERIATHSFGPLQLQADLLLRWLTAHSDRDIVLISLSKSSAEIRLALAQSPGSFAPVRVWMSFSGLMNGNPLVDWLHARTLRRWAVSLILRWRGQRYATALEMRRTSKNDWPALPRGMRLVQIVGVPRRSDLSHRWAPKAFDRLAPLGPTDGGGLILGDLCSAPGDVYPVWGADHYLSPSWDLLPMLRALLLDCCATPTDRSEDRR